MSGYAAISGVPDGQPLLPPIALTDEVTGLVAAFATMVALRSGVGQVVDVSLLESMFQIMGPLVSLYQVTGAQQPRLGAGLPYTVPRGTYRCCDGKWVGVSTSADTVAARVLRLLGVGDDDRVRHVRRADGEPRALEEIMVAWCARRTQAEVISAFEAAEAAIGPVMDMADISADPHYAARGAIVDIDGTPMQGLVATLSATPGRLDWAGRGVDADGAAIRASGWDAFDEQQPPTEPPALDRSGAELVPVALELEHGLVDQHVGRFDAALLAERLDLCERSLELAATGPGELFELALDRVEPGLHPVHRGGELVPLRSERAEQLQDLVRRLLDHEVVERLADHAEEGEQRQRRAEHDLLREGVLHEAWIVLVHEPADRLVGEEQQHVVDRLADTDPGVVALGELLHPQPDVFDEGVTVGRALGVARPHRGSGGTPPAGTSRPCTARGPSAT